MRTIIISHKALSLLCDAGFEEDSAIRHMPRSGSSHGRWYYLKISQQDFDVLQRLRRPKESCNDAIIRILTPRGFAALVQHLNSKR